MKRVLIIFIAIALCACEKETKETTDDWKLKNTGLEDCQFFYMTNNSGNSIYVVRCPNSQTTTHYETGGKAKHRENVTVIDDK